MNCNKTGKPWAGDNCCSCGFNGDCEAQPPTPSAGSTGSTASASPVAEPDWTKPPCQECGATTLEEAEKMCICSGDKDYCHGQELWPD